MARRRRRPSHRPGLTRPEAGTLTHRPPARTRGHGRLPATSCTSTAWSPSNTSTCSSPSSLRPGMCSARRYRQPRRGVDHSGRPQPLPRRAPSAPGPGRSRSAEGWRAAPGFYRGWGRSVLWAAACASDRRAIVAPLVVARPRSHALDLQREAEEPMGGLLLTGLALGWASTTSPSARPGACRLALLAATTVIGAVSVILPLVGLGLGTRIDVATARGRELRRLCPEGGRDRDRCRWPIGRCDPQGDVPGALHE